MVALRSRRLESVFGAKLSEVTADHIRTLVTSEVQEAFDLDFKSELYGRSDQDKRALGGDVAALANTAGGVIVLGIEEDEQARASSASGILITDAEVARIHQVVASLVAPMPALDVIPVIEDRATSRGFILLAVPRSPSAPHAVLINDGLRYPRRNGATTRYLSEPEVATAYRDRLRGFAMQQERIGNIEDLARAKLGGGDPWLLLSIVPDLEGEARINEVSFRNFQQTISGSSAAVVDVGVTYCRASVGRRCFHADDRYGDEPGPHRTALQLHSNGAGTYALRLHDVSRRAADPPSNPGDLGDPLLILDEWLSLGVLSGLLKLGDHAQNRAAAGGNVVVRAQIIGADTKAMGIAHMRAHSGAFAELRTRTPIIISDPPAEVAVSLDSIATPNADLVAAAASLADELGQGLGVTEMGQLGVDGSVRRRYWSQNAWQTALVSWADRHGIPVSDATIV